MAFMSNMNIGLRLGLSHGSIVLLLAAITGTGLYGLNQLNEATQLITGDRMPKLALSADIRNHVGTVASNLRDLLLTTDPEEVRQYTENVVAARSKIAAGMEQMDALVNTDTGRKLFVAMQDARTRFIDNYDRVITLAEAGQREEATAFMLSTVAPLQIAYDDAMTALNDLQTQLADGSAVQAEAIFDQEFILLLGLAGLALLLAAGVAFWATRSITGPLGTAVAMAQKVAEGDLTSELAVSGTDETGQLLQALKTMNENLRKIAGDVRSSTDLISTASQEIASGNADLSQRTEEQASSLEETASSMEELTSTVKQNAENSRQANQLALGASEVAVKGGEVVNQVVSTMSEINTSSKKIADIIGVIDSIAFQTNILALNAAVEAARAGEQGRGFAVVASEVRTLAQRSAAAAKEIKELIEDSVSKVDNGSKLVDQAGRTMEEVVDSIKRVTSIMAEITAASQEQSDGIEQVNQAVTQMDEVTQQNAALVEEAAAAAESMQDQAQVLSRAMEVFKLSHDNRTQTTASAKSASARPRMAATVTRLPSRIPDTASASHKTEAPKPASKPRKLANARPGSEEEWTEF
ncbi:MAG: methyl-accepting chemotaxis protein [Pseudomonadales bacterium]|nr:methyl-accepting chemotaxis protein [Pseudomonadales bacterium]